jgi:hypothetical protein
LEWNIVNAFRSGGPGAVLSALSLVAICVAGTVASAADHTAATVVVSGHMIPTGGELNFSEPKAKPLTRAMRRHVLSTPRTAQQAAAQTTWLDDLIDYVAGPAPQTQRAKRIAPASKPGAATVALVTPEPQLPPPTEAQPQPFPRTSSIVTGTLPVPPPPAPQVLDQPMLHPGDATAAVIQAAERTQARHDLVKLELASRTYGERRLSGQSAFDLRTDWRILERARDALASAELSVAEAAGFEGNAYINETDKIIVVAIAGTQDLRRDFLEADIWRALIQSQSPQQFFLAKSYIRSVIQRYQMRGFTTECVGHSLGGGACAYAAAELGIRAIVVNPISAGPLATTARHLVTNYVVDGDIASYIYAARGNEISGDIQRINAGRESAGKQITERFGPLAGPVLVIRDLRNAVRVHQIDRALDLIAAHADTIRVR